MECTFGKSHSISGSSRCKFKKGKKPPCLEAIPQQESGLQPATRCPVSLPFGLKRERVLLAAALPEALEGKNGNIYIINTRRAPSGNRNAGWSVLEAPFAR